MKNNVRKQNRRVKRPNKILKLDPKSGTRGGGMLKCTGYCGCAI